jgi:hypothetical protein
LIWGAAKMLAELGQPLLVPELQRLANDEDWAANHFAVQQPGNEPRLLP